MRRTLMLLLLIILSALLIASRFYPKVERIEVSGMTHFSKEELLALANLAPQDPLVWVNRWRLRNLMANPWIYKARIIRHWPDTVSLTVWERQAVATDGVQTYALDGTVLPNVAEEVKEGLVRIEGWGNDRSREALELVQLLAEYDLKVISYSPDGFDLRLAETTVFTPSLAALKEHWAGFVSQQGSKISVYPWGVSVKP